MTSQFFKPNGMIYLDGNSLGMLPNAVAERVNNVVQQQWGNDLINSWNQHDWINLPLTVGDKIARLLGAAPGQVVCCDSISLNLFKVLSAALQLREGRNTVLSTADNFPTDLYMVQGLQQLVGEQQCQLKLVAEQQLVDAIDETTAVVLVTEVNFRSGQRLDLATLSQLAHQHGALIIADLAHSAGAMAIELDHWQVDFAVGCTYKYLNAGPGAPGFVYVAKRHHDQFRQPLYGWMGHANAFEFAAEYRPAAGIRALLTGTPSIIALAAVDAALTAFDGHDLAQLHQQALDLADQFDNALQQHDIAGQFQRLTPLTRQQRGCQLSYAHPQAYAICQALIAAGVIADFRAPNYLRFGFTPLYLSAVEVEQAAQKLAEIIHHKRYLAAEFQQRRGTVT
ncbi:kynureninase [Pseudidiomarina mangrovi]|uniref:kynureninase n=1 Tax=Pseudidiomarina mangrovi TaxID=2487133 RepID=UPI000FCB65A9|nr:kynureninase [Pseudidiomarina mangrovi]